MFNKKLLLFLAAAFSLTQIRIVGYIGISELVMLLIGPFVLVKYWNSLKRDGFAPCLSLVALWVFSALVTDFYRQTSLNDLLRGVASPISVLFVIPCIYWLLKDDVRQIKWAIIGFTVTLFLSTYIIQSGTSVSRAEMQGITAREAAEEYKLTFMALVLSVVSLVPALAYLKIPFLSALITLGVAVFSLIQGGRSAFLALLISAGMLFLVGGNVSKIRRVAKQIPAIMVALLVLVYAAKLIYKGVAMHGYMGEAELHKYETQAASKIGIMSGRNHFIAVYYAVCDSPILGHGSWARDYRGYGIRAAEWMEDDVAIEHYYSHPGISWIPAHSHIFCAYVWHGVLGAVFWCYVLWVMWQTFRHYLGEVPEVFSILALSLPSFLWAILFSPFGGRVSAATTIVLCLLIKNSRKRRQAVARFGVGH